MKHLSIKENLKNINYKLVFRSVQLQVEQLIIINNQLVRRQLQPVILFTEHIDHIIIIEETNAEPKIHQRIQQISINLVIVILPRHLKMNFQTFTVMSR